MLLNEAETELYWFFIPEGAKSWARILRLWSLETNGDLIKKISKLRSFDKEKPSDELNVEIIRKTNPAVGEDDAKSILRNIQSVLRQNDGERPLFSAYVLNEFLNQSEIERYGDFLELRWDELYDDLKSYRFNIYPNTFKIFKLFQVKESILLLRSRTTAVVKAALENLTIEELSKLSKMDERALRSKAAVIPERISALLAPVEKLPSADVVQNEFFVAFSRTVAKAGIYSGRNHFSQAEDFILYLNKIHKFLYIDPKSARADAIPSSSASRIAQLIVNNPNEFTPLAVTAIVFSISYPELFSSSSRAAARRFFVTISEHSDERAVAALKAIANIGVIHRGNLPSVAELEQALNEGLFELDLDPVALFALMGFTSNTRRVLSQDASDFIRANVRR